MSSEEMPTINVHQGQLFGSECTTLYGARYYAFEGIPYAKPPLGDLRFKAPQYAEPWEDILDCSQPLKKKPIQLPDGGEVTGTEDCLYLNVFTKTFSSIKPLPVMVWIFGGGWYMGNATRARCGPDYFMQKNVILVTFNYRVGALGFLSLSDPELDVPGNAGLKDQVMALEWVRDNIKYFNGDPKNITVFGESAGGVNTHYMTVTERTRDLFQKAIVMSGNLYNSFAVRPRSNYAFRLAEHLGYTGDQDECNVLEFLCKQPAESLSYYKVLKQQEKDMDYHLAFAPVIEPYSTPECVIPEAPLIMLRKSWGNNIPIIFGGTSQEGLMVYSMLKENPEVLQLVWKQPESVLPYEVRQAHTAKENKEFATKIIQAHYGDATQADENEIEEILKHVDLITFKLFWHGIHRSILARLRDSDSKTYLYRFDFDSPHFNLMRKQSVGGDPVRGVAHADDLCYMFLMDGACKLEMDSPEYRCIVHLVGVLTAFAATSDPNCPEIDPIAWQCLQKEEPNLALNIDEDLCFGLLEEAEVLQIWNSIYQKKPLI